MSRGGMSQNIPVVWGRDSKQCRRSADHHALLSLTISLDTWWYQTSPCSDPEGGSVVLDLLAKEHNVPPGQHLHNPVKLKDAFGALFYPFTFSY